jgi:hypothetical protein
MNDKVLFGLLAILKSFDNLLFRMSYFLKGLPILRSCNMKVELDKPK